MDIPENVVRHIAFDHSQHLMGYVMAEMAKCERKLDSDAVTKARFVALRDVLDYLETDYWAKPYRVEDVSSIKITQLSAPKEESTKE